MLISIRDETPADIAIIGDVIRQAMSVLAIATGTEAAIVERLRAAGALTLSLVAEKDGEVVGHLAASPGLVGEEEGWGLIGPVGVLPPLHGQGIGSALMVEAIRRLKPTHRGAALVGHPAYYPRFGFRAFPGLYVPGCPPEVVMALPFDGSEPDGELIHHPAFGLDQQG
ncbi:N-acetyltransferase [Breoghania sp.]|uniref:GNAT family N-acetyltransferase n=1 Tax=Breoghania sp. TaxID=2065378 RepID=UPI002AA87893|nr:N-acetyltransferase [Breoghania sp.]